MDKRSGKMFGHLLNSSFMTNIFEGQINGRKGRGTMKAYIVDMIRQTDCNRYIDMKRLAFNREE